MNYTLPCTKEEYHVIREKREELIKRRVDGLDDDWQRRTKGLEVTFRYNPAKGVIGVFVKNNGEYVLADSNQTLAKSQTIAGSVISNNLLEIIQEELKKIRLSREEEWID